MDLTKEERYELCDMGYYNDVIRGYLIAAMQDADFSRKDINSVLGALRGVFDTTSAEEADAIWQKY